MKRSTAPPAIIVPNKQLSVSMTFLTAWLAIHFLAARGCSVVARAYKALDSIANIRYRRNPKLHVQGRRLAARPGPPQLQAKSRSASLHYESVH